jgi:hypothetical protein
MICQPSYLLNIASVNFFLFWQLKAEMADLSLSQSSLKKSLEGVVRTISKNESAAALDGGWTTAKSTSKSALTRPKKVLK